MNAINGNRKLAVALLSLALAFVLAWTGRLTAEFTTIVSIVAGGFYAANTLGDHRK
jgi:hypothetical protein